MPRFLARLAFLLRPGWIALILVVIAFTYLCFMVLAPWQLGKNARTSRENQQIENSLNTAPVPLKTLLPQQDSSASNAQWRRVTATGHYLPDVEVLARLRVVEGDQAFEVLVPFVVDDGPTVLVDRGYVRPEPGSHVPPLPRPPQETVTLTARLRDSEPAIHDKEPFYRDGVQQVYSINTEQISVLTKVPLTGSYLQLVENQPGGLGVIDVPHLDAGPFLSYGIQWISFGILAPIGLGYFAYSEIRARRQHKQQASSAETPMTVEEKLDDRYGRHR
jgi:cytochrome oxidase assembly protein ShyY1